jgi:uncharacterized protein YcnI
MRRTPLVAGLVAILLVLWAGPASAHVEVEPGQAVAGSTTTVTFRFHHGKDGSATTGLEVKVPDGAEVVEVPAVPGWTSSTSADGTVVTWSGGSVPDGTEGAFPLVLRLPAAAGVVLFPTIQTTEAGELAWISEEEGDGEDASPAPRIELTPGTGSTDGTTTTEATPTTRDLPRTALEADQRDDGGGSVAPWFLGSGLAAVAAIAIGGAVLRRRSS